MTKNDILTYVTETPTNTNRAVLSHMLDSFESGDNKQEIELLAQENKVYTPTEGKVYNKVTVNVPAPASDFYKPVINLEATGGNGLQATFLISPTDSPAEMSFISGVSVNEYGLTSDSRQVVVTSGTPTTADDIYILNEHKICIWDVRLPDTNIYTVTGDCTVKSIELEGETAYYVEVYGNCSISVEGVR